MSHRYESHPSAQDGWQGWSIIPLVSDSPPSLRFIPLLACNNRSHIFSSDCQRTFILTVVSPPDHSDVVGGQSGGLLNLPPERHPLWHSRWYGSAYRLCSWKHLCSHFTLSWRTSVSVSVHVWRTPSKHLYVNIHFPPTVTLRTGFCCSVISFLLGWSKSGVRAFVWHLSITSGQWCIPQSNLLPMLRAHMCFPLQQEAKEHIIQPVTIQPLPQQWVHSLLVPHGERTAFWAWTRWDAVKPDLLSGGGGREEGGDSQREAFTTPSPPTQLNKPHECGTNAHQSCRGYTRSVWNLCWLIIFDFYTHAGSWGSPTTASNSEWWAAAPCTGEDSKRG